MAIRLRETFTLIYVAILLCYSLFQGCYDKFNEYIDKYQYWAIGVSATLIAIEVCFFAYMYFLISLVECPSLQSLNGGQSGQKSHCSNFKTM